MLDIVVIGGGAAGYFAAISAIENVSSLRISIYEKSSKLLSKVKISGGGRCNVTHSCFTPKELVKFYPRGGQELLGPFFRWQPSDTVEWFKNHDVPLKTESDGRIFPTTDSSQTIIDCFNKCLSNGGVNLFTKVAVENFAKIDTGEGFELSLSDGNTIRSKTVIIATGGGQSSGGLKLARKFGHTVTKLSPSLFTFHIKDPRINGLQGLSVNQVAVSCPDLGLTTRGPMLVTHWGLSGPAILKLSSLGARDFQQLQYKFQIIINWTGGLSQDETQQRLNEFRKSHGPKRLESGCPFSLPKRIWERIILASEIEPKKQWAQLNKEQLKNLVGQISSSLFSVSGKSMNKDEFVTCGGVSLKEVDFRSMESKFTKGLFFAGEVLDIDGVTGGFNFQAAWTTGRLAGVSASESVLNL